MTNVNVKEFAEQLSELLMKIEDSKCEVRALLDAAKEAGIDTKALNKIAKELITEPGKLNKKYAQEEQLDLFRAEVGIFHRKGLETTERAQVAFKAIGEKKLIESAEALDAVAGSDIAKTYKQNMHALRKWNAKRQEADQ